MGRIEVSRTHGASYGEVSSGRNPWCLPRLARRSKIAQGESGEETMANHSKERTEADADFKQTRKAQRATDAIKAMSEYKAARDAEVAKTARLKEQRLAKEADTKANQGTKSK